MLTGPTGRGLFAEPIAETLDQAGDPSRASELLRGRVALLGWIAASSYSPSHGDDDGLGRDLASRRGRR